jgi:uncharacterized protein YcfJ
MQLLAKTTRRQECPDVLFAHRLPTHRKLKLGNMGGLVNMVFLVNGIILI